MNLADDLHASTQTETLRYNIYTVIHKALRAMMWDTLSRVSRMDPYDDVESAEALGQLRTLLAVCLGHLKKENEFVHPALERAQPNSALHTADDHVEHLAAIAQLQARSADFEKSTGAARRLAAHRLYLDLSHFVGDNFTHMFVEETDNQAVLIRHYSDAGLMALEGRIVASIPPQESAHLQRWIVPNMNPQERLAMFAGMRARAPAEAFGQMLTVARETLSQGDFDKLARGLQQRLSGDMAATA